MLEKKIYPPTGSKIKCKNWQIEAAYRMIQHNVCNEVAEYPEELIVYGGKGKAARNWDCFESILDSLVKLEEDETLLIQSGKPVLDAACAPTDNANPFYIRMLQQNQL